MKDTTAVPRLLKKLDNDVSGNERREASSVASDTATQASGPRPWPTPQSQHNAVTSSPSKGKPLPRTYQRAAPKRVGTVGGNKTEGDSALVQQEGPLTDTSHPSTGSGLPGTPSVSRKDSAVSLIREGSPRASVTPYNPPSRGRRHSPAPRVPSPALKHNEETQSSDPASFHPSPRKKEEAAAHESVSQGDRSRVSSLGSQPGEMTPLCPSGRQGSADGAETASGATAPEASDPGRNDERPASRARSGENFFSGLFAHIKRRVAGVASPSSASDASEEVAFTEPVGQAQTAVNSIMEKALRVKAQMKRSPYLVSLAVIGASFGALWAGFFGVVSCFFSLHPFIALIKLYQVVFATVCLGTELARYSSAFGIRGLLKEWAPVLELTVGRGFIQLLTAGLALGVCRFGFIEWLPGLVLCVTSLFNVAWGIKSACKLRELMVKLKEQMQQSEEDVENDAVTADHKVLTTATVRRLARKFRALDVNGDGRLSRDEVAAGCRNLNIALDDGDVDMMFTLLDRKKRGYIDIDDFELWWYNEKSPFSVLV